MAVPKFRVSSRKRDMRRAHHAISVTGSSVCKNCGVRKRQHSVCESCGFHKGVQVIEPKTDKGWAQDFATES